MRKVIVNSTPLIILCNIGKLELLKQLYEEIHIPEAVFREVTVRDDSVCQQIKQCQDWIRVDTIQDISEKKMYRAKLHDGEVEVMILAQQDESTELVIIDDNAAKQTAKYLGLPVAGTIGVLMKAKEEGILTEIKPILDNMKEKGFYISDNVMTMVLKQVKELNE